MAYPFRAPASPTSRAASFPHPPSVSTFVSRSVPAILSHVAPYPWGLDDPGPGLTAASPGIAAPTKTFRFNSLRTARTDPCEPLKVSDHGVAIARASVPSSWPDRTHVGWHDAAVASFADPPKPSTPSRDR
jgi:hypothetical protein